MRVQSTLEHWKGTKIHNFINDSVQEKPQSWCHTDDFHVRKNAGKWKPTPPSPSTKKKSTQVPCQKANHLFSFKYPKMGKRFILNYLVLQVHSIK